MPEVMAPTAQPLSALRRVELIHTGQWRISTGVWNASRADLVAAMAAQDCPAVRRPVIKLGHSQAEDPLWQGNPTGAPAVGWVDNLTLTNQGHTLVGDFVGMPGWLGDVAASAYPDRSVEGKYDFRCQIGHTHPFVLTAVALLGVTPPGVGTLKSLHDIGALYGVEANGDAGTAVVAHLPGRHNQSAHGNRYLADGSLIPRQRRLTRTNRRQTVRALDDALADIEDDEAANRPGMSGGPLVDLVQGIRDGVAGGQFTPDQALQLVSMLVFRPDVASNPSLSTALASATGRLRGVQAAVWREADHPRDDDGQFIDKGGQFSLDLAEGTLGVGAGPDGQVRLSLGDASGAQLAPDAADDLIDALREGLEDGFEIDIDGVNLSREGDDYHLDLGDGSIPLAPEELPPLADAIDEARAPVVEVETSAGDLRARLRPSGDVSLRLDDTQEVVESEFAVRDIAELAESLGDLLDAELPDDVGTGDIVEGYELESGIDVTLYGSGVVEVGWDDGDERVEFNLDPDDIEPVQDALQRLADEAGHVAATPAREPELRQVAAAADVRTGAMVALLPSDGEAQRLAAQGGESPGQLHATVLFLGEADSYSTDARQALVDAVRDLAAVIPPGDADGMAIAAFNPDKPDKDTCIVLELGGEALDDVHGLVNQAIGDVAAEYGLAIPEQHKPYRPHITLVYSDDLSKVSELADRAGPVRLDRIRVAFAGDNTDIPLTGGASDAVAAQAGSDRPLRNYWLYGEGAAKIQWRTPGDHTRCVRQLRKYVSDPEGLCAEYHFEANGFWPGDRRNLVHAMDQEAMILPNPNPTIVNAAAQVSVDDVRTAFYRQAGQQQWIREFHTHPQRLIVANDADGTVARVDFRVGDDGSISFEQAVPVRVEYVEQGAEADTVAASRMVYASAAESRPDVAAEAGGDHWRRQFRDRDGQWSERGGGNPFSGMPRLSDADRADLRQRSNARKGRTAPAPGAPDITVPVPPSGRTGRFGDRDPLQQPSRPRRQRRREQEDLSEARSRSEERDRAEMLDAEEGERRQQRSARIEQDYADLLERERDLGRTGELPQREAYESILDEAQAVLRQRFAGRRSNPQMSSQIERLRRSIADGDHDGAYNAGSALSSILESYVSEGDLPTLRRPPSGLRMRRVRAAADPQPKPPAAEPGNPSTKEDDMPLSTEVYQRLGLAEDADHDTVSAAVLTALDKADGAPDPMQVAAAAAENVTLTQKVALLQEQVTGLSKQIADDNAAKVAEVKASVIDEAVTKGRIAPADRDKWAERYDRAPDAVADVLASITDGTAVPVTVHGKAGDPMAAADDLPPEPDWLYGPNHNEPAMAGKE